jgi:hypothetical protein
MERGIDTHEIRRIVNLPIDSLTSYDDGEKKYTVYGTATDPYTRKSRYLLIVYKNLNKPDTILVITAIWLSKGGLEKYGFKNIRNDI